MERPAPAPKPVGMPSLSTHLWFNGNCRSAIEAYRGLLGASLEDEILEWPDDPRVLHALLRIGGTPLMLADALPGAWEHGPEGETSASLWLYVDDCDAVFDRTTAAGWKVMLPLADAFWGDRFGKVKDPYGHVWSLATWKWERDPEEIARRRDQWLRT
jgi:PhnB protein